MREVKLISCGEKPFNFNHVRKNQVGNGCVLLQKRKFISQGTQKQYSTTFSNARTVQMAKFLEISLGISHFLPARPSWKYHVKQNLRNSSVVYGETKNPFGTKICMDISFQLLLYIIEVKYQEDHLFCSLNFCDIMWKPAI